MSFGDAATRRSLAIFAVVLLIIVGGVAVLYAVRSQETPTRVFVAPTQSPTPTASAALNTSTPIATPPVVPTATPTFTVTARPGCARVETGDIQACPGSGPIGTTLTVSGRNWSCTVPGARVDLVFAGYEGEGIATGAVGGFSFPPVQPDANGDWMVTVRIPATLDPDKGQGGGPTTPGIYRILSKPAYCAADFTVVR